MVELITPLPGDHRVTCEGRQKSARTQKYLPSRGVAATALGRFDARAEELHRFSQLFLVACNSEHARLETEVRVRRDKRRALNQ